MSKNTGRLSENEKLKWQYMLSVTSDSHEVVNWNIFSDRYLAENTLSIAEAGYKYGLTAKAIQMRCYRVRDVLGRGMLPEPTDAALEEKWKIFSKNNRSSNLLRDWDIYVSRLWGEASLTKREELVKKYDIHKGSISRICKDVSDRVGTYAPEDMVSGDDVLDLYLGMPSADLDD